MKPLDKELLKLLYQEHLKGAMISDLARANSIRPATLYYALKRIGPVVRGFMKGKGDYSKIFPVVTKESAYIYGLWAADGHKSGKHWTIKLHTQDQYLLEIIREFIGANNLYTDISNPNCRSLIVNFGYNTKIDEDWFPLRKTGNLLFPVLRYDLYSHFIRGYFDGDGSISRRLARPNQVQLYWCSIDPEFLKRIAMVLHGEEIYTSMHRENRSYPEKDMYTLRVGDHQSRLTLFQWLYQDKGQFYMHRKFHKFESYVNTVLSSGISIRPRNSVTHSS